MSDEMISRAEADATVAAALLDLAHWCEGERQIRNEQGDHPGAVAYRRLCLAVQKRSYSRTALDVIVREAVEAERARLAVEPVIVIDAEGMRFTFKDRAEADRFSARLRGLGRPRVSDWREYAVTTADEAIKSVFAAIREEPTA